MKNLLTITLFLGSLTTFSQTLSLSEGTTRAVIIGISDYKHEKIPDLRFADKDAKAFATYLQSPAGGNLKEEHLKILLNEQATFAQIASEIDWLVDVSQEGDQAIIYFSGHGDVETKTARDPGFLLAYDCLPNLYIAGAYQLAYLQLIIETLSNEKNVKTIVIADACRAGKLAGSDIGGTQVTAANLAKQYANEIKILSCQPNEYSLEGEQWGGGRGVFSYHLIEGLIGLADKNGNLQVNLLELENYLENIVPEETAPQSQIPLTVGSKGTQIANVNSDVLAELRSLKERELPTLAAIESKGFEETLLAGLDSTIQKKYDEFIASLNGGNLLDSKDGKPSADALYRELIQEPTLSSLHRFMTRQFAASLQADAQDAINIYLEAKPSELSKRWKGDTTYGQYPRYLARAAELLGENHYMHNYLIANQLYFEGLNLRLKGDQNNRNISFYRQAIEKQKAAIQLEDRAAYFYNELGVLHTQLKLDKKAFEYYEKAIELAPEWGLPYVNYSIGLFYVGEYETAIKYGEKALEFLPNFPQLYNFLAWIHANEYDWMNKQNWLRKGLDLSESESFDEASVNEINQLKIKYQPAIELLEKAALIDTNYMQTFKNLGIIYFQLGEHLKAENALKKAIVLDGSDWDTYYNLGRSYLFEGRFDEAEQVFNKALELVKNPWESAEIYNSIYYVYKARGEIEKAIKTQEKVRELNPYFSFSLINESELYRELGEYEKAERFLLKELHNSEFPVTKSYLGRLYSRNLNRWEDAEYFCLKSLEGKDDLQRSFQTLSEIYRDTRQLKKEYQWLQKQVESTPDDPQLLIYLGQSAYLDKQFDEAETYFKKAAELSTFPDLISAISGFYMYHGETKHSISYANQAIEMDSTFSPVYIVLAASQFLDNNLEACLVSLDKGMKVASTNEGAKLWFTNQKIMLLYLTGHIQESIKLTRQLETAVPAFNGLVDMMEKIEGYDLDAALEAVEKVRQLAPEDPHVHYLFCKLKIKQGKFEAAASHLPIILNGYSYAFIKSDTTLNPIRNLHQFQQIIRERFPEKYNDLDTFSFVQKPAVYFPENCLLLAKYFEKHRDIKRAKQMYEKAETLLQKAIELDSTDWTLYKNLTEIFLKQQRGEEALTMFKRAKELNPSYQITLSNSFTHMPLSFENAHKDSQIISFGSANFGAIPANIVTNPHQHKKNTSPTVLHIKKTEGAQVHAGVALPLLELVDLSTGPVFELKLWSPRAGVPILLKFEDTTSKLSENGDSAIKAEVQMNTTTANTWETLVFDMSTHPDYSALNKYTHVVIFPDFGNVGIKGGEDFYIDDIKSVNATITKQTTSLSSENPNWSDAYFYLTKLALLNDQIEKAWQYFERGFEIGIGKNQWTYENLISDSDFKEMHKSLKWNQLMQNYFPEQHKIKR